VPRRRLARFEDRFWSSNPARNRSLTALTPSRKPSTTILLIYCFVTVPLGTVAPLTATILSPLVAIVPPPIEKLVVLS
jgi:hypothetical protein